MAGQAARRPRRRPRPGRGAEPRPRRPPPQPEDDAPDRGLGDDLRRVRLLRAGMPEPQPDDDAAPADRPAARDGAPAGRLAAPAGPARGVRVRLARDLRRRRLLPARLPGRDRHRQAGQGAARRSPHGGGRIGRRCGTAERWGAVEGGPRRPPGRGPVGAPHQAREGLPGLRQDGDAEGRAREGAAAVYLPSCTNRIFGRGRAGASLPEAIVASRASGAAGLDPARGRRDMLRPSLELERATARPTAGRQTRWSNDSGSGAGRGSCRS